MKSHFSRILLLRCFALCGAMVAASLLSGCVTGYDAVDKVELFPRLPVNVFCKEGKHQLPKFRKEQVLVVYPKLAKNVGSDESKDTLLAFPDGSTTSNMEGTYKKLGNLWKSGRYKLLVYDCSSERLKVPLNDFPWTRFLRAYALKRGIPMVILYGTDGNSPLLEGIAPGKCQYWQCPQCARSYDAMHQTVYTADWDVRNLLLFPLNIVPNAVIGSCLFTWGCIKGVFTTDEYAQLVWMALPLAPVAGIVYGTMEAWEGTPFWRLEIVSGVFK